MGKVVSGLKWRAAAVAFVTAAGLLITGCGSKTARPNPPVTRGGLGPSVPATVPFSQVKAGPMDAVDFVSDKAGYAAGQGLILKTVDGGNTWMRIYTTPDTILAVDAVDAAHVWAAARDYVLRSTDGWRFDRVTLPSSSGGAGGTGITALDLVTGDRGFVLADGAVWRLDGGGVPEKATPEARIDSLSFVDGKTGFAAGGNVLYKTVDGGNTWSRLFAAPVVTSGLDGAWRAAVRAASATNVWLLVAGGGHGMSQQAYVVFHSTNGAAFAPVLAEGYFASLYPSVHLLGDANLGAQPGPFTVSGGQAAFFVGWYPEQLQLTVTLDNGRTFVKYPVGRPAGPSEPDFFSPMGISFADTTHGWLVGSSRVGATGGGKGPRPGVILRTTDGHTFVPVP